MPSAAVGRQRSVRDPDANSLANSKASTALLGEKPSRFSWPKIAILAALRRVQRGDNGTAAKQVHAHVANDASAAPTPQQRPSALLDSMDNKLDKPIPPGMFSRFADHADGLKTSSLVALAGVTRRAPVLNNSAIVLFILTGALILLLLVLIYLLKKRRVPTDKQSLSSSGLVVLEYRSQSKDAKAFADAVAKHSSESEASSEKPQERKQHYHNGKVIYEWDQTSREVCVYIKPPPGLKRSDFEIKVDSSTIKVGRKGKLPFLKDQLYGVVDKTSSSWSLRSSGELQIRMVKVTKGDWPVVCLHQRKTTGKSHGTSMSSSPSLPTQTSTCPTSAPASSSFHAPSPQRSSSFSSNPPRAEVSSDASSPAS